MGNNPSSVNSISKFSKIPSVNFRYSDWTEPAIIYNGASINITNMDSDETAYIYFDGVRYVLQEMAIDLAPTDNTEIHLIHKKDDTSAGAAHVIVNIIINNGQNQSFWNILMRHNVLNIPANIYKCKGVPFKLNQSHLYLRHLASVLSEYKHVEKFYYRDNKYTLNGSTTKTNFIIMKTPFSGLNFAKNVQQKLVCP